MSLFDDASLVLIPDGAKDGTLYSVKPTDGTGDFTFTRGSNLAATRVDENGLIEKGRENLFLQSNTFDVSTNWINTNSTETSGQSGYDGSSDAWKITSTSTLNAFLRQIISFSGVNTISVYAKAGTSNFLLISIEGGGNTWFNLSAGTIGTDASISSNIEDMGSGWYRCSVVWNASITGVRLYVCDADNSAAVTSGNFIYIQDAQVEQGLVATDYIETGATTAQAGILEDLPRIDYSGGASCPALLLEPQRTNDFPHSEYLDSWTSNRLDRTANNVDSPEGVQNAYKMAQQSGLTTAPNIAYAGITAGTKTLSIFAKAGTFDHIALVYDGTTYFDLTNGTIGTTAIGHTAVITNMGNGWYRCAITKTTTGTYTAAYYFAQNDGTITTSDTQGYMYAYGAMIEAGSYPTSYIPTYGSSVTRSADVPNISSGSSIFNDSEGTFYVEIEGLSDTTSVKVITIGDGTSSNRVQIFYQSGTNITTNVISGGSAQVSGFTTSATQTDNNKVLIRYASNNAKMYLNGTEIASDTSVTPPSGLNVLRFDNGVGAALFEGEVKQLLYFPTALTDAECIALTRPYNTYQEWVDGEGLTWESKSCTNQSILELQNL